MAPTHEEVFAAAALVVIFDACELRLQADSSEMKLRHTTRWRRREH